MRHHLVAALVFTSAFAFAQQQEEPETRYEGPTILSRDRSLIGERSGKLLDYRFYGEVTGAYDTGLTPVSVDPQGRLVQPGAAYGVETGFGLSGTRRWKHDVLSLDYHGGYRHYTNNSYFDGTDQFLGLSYQHQFTRRLSLQVNETAGILSLANGAFTYVPLSNVDPYAVPTNELFDNRTEYLETRGILTYQKTLRLSYSFGGSGYVVRRRSLALASLNGYSAYGDVAYRLSKRQTVSVNFQYVTYDYLRLFGDATIYTGELGYSIALTRRTELALKGGLARIDATGLANITLDPAIAAIVGHPTATTVFRATRYIPTYEGRLIRRFERSAVTLYGASAFSPGNGVYLTSRMTNAGFDYSYTGFKRFNFGASVSYSRLGSIAQQTFGNYNGVNAGAGFTYKLVRSTHIEARYDYRHYDTTFAGFKKNSQRVSLGLAFSPGEKPLSIW